MRYEKWKSVLCPKISGVSRGRPCRGFTLLEVIIALGIVSVGILGVSRVIAGYAGTTATLETRMVANWVAGNRLTTLRLLSAKPQTGTKSGFEAMVERDWYFSEITTATADPLLYRVDITVFSDREETDEVGMLTGYLLDEPEIINIPTADQGGDQPPHDSN